MYKRIALLFAAIGASGALAAGGAAGPTDPQPLIAQAKRVLAAADLLGSPLAAGDVQALRSAFVQPDAGAAAAAIGRILDKYCLFQVTISPEERVAVERGPARAELQEGGWRQFLVKVRNAAGVTAPLQATSPNARSVFGGVMRTWVSTASDRAYNGAGQPAPTPVYDRWLDMQTFDDPPMVRDLGGLEVEYRIIQLYSRDAGRREAKIAFDVGQGTQEAGFGNECDVLFDCRPAHPVRLRIRDENGRPVIASLLIRDAAGRVVPSQAKRLAPDFAFQPQIYRQDGEEIRLPEGAYTVKFWRGPETVPQFLTLRVGPDTREWSFQVQRWIDLSQLGWWSGDHHIHAAGCAHYCEPSQGVLPSDMERQCLGEDLKVGAVLTFGPCFDYQKQFFEGRKDTIARYPYILHYDIEVSGFGSQRSGHLCLLNLTDQVYPGSESTDGWPTFCLKTLRWAKRQGAITGTAHSGWGLQPAVPNDKTVPVSTSAAVIHTQTDELPNYVIPPYNGIGANEYVVDVTHEVPGPDGRLVPAVDIYSSVNTPCVWELNMWYHTLNCGYRTRLAGETDFPCIYLERVGMGRSYVKLDGPLTYAAWCEGLRLGRSYVGDGRTHLLDFAVDGAALGENGSEIRLAAPATVRLTARVAAYLPVRPDLALRDRPDNQQPYWDVERARLGDSRDIAVEVVVNGRPVAQQRLTADGAIRPLSFSVPIERSSWIALRVLRAAHTNPIFVLVGGKPIRASRRSAAWCLQGVDRCWSQKQRFISAGDKPEALAAYDHAREAYRGILRDSDAD